MLKQLGYLTLTIVAAFVGATIVASAQSSMPVDRSQGYFGGAVPRYVDPPQQNNQRTIIDLSPSINVGGVLGCAGLEIDAMMRDVLGVGNIDASALADQMAQNLKSQFAQQMLTQIMSDPTVASIQQQISAMANARLTMMKAECNAIQARQDGVAAMVRAEAQKRCHEQYGVNDNRCEDGTLLREAVEEVVAEPRWSKSFHEQICDRDKEQCDWLRLIPDFTPNLGVDGAPKADNSSGGGNDTSSSSGADTGGSSSSSGAGSSGGSAPAAEQNKDVKPPVFSIFDAKDIARNEAFDIISQNADEGRNAVSRYGYTEALELSTNMDKRLELLEKGGQKDDSSGTATSESIDLPPAVMDMITASSCSEFSLLNTSTFSQDPMEPSSEEISTNNQAPVVPPSRPDIVSSAPQPASAIQPGSLGWPLNKGRVTSTMGPRQPPGGKGSSNHGGWDIASQPRRTSGEPLFAVVDGIAASHAQGGGRTGFGYYVTLTSGRYVFYYGHLDSYGKTGRVSAGDVIGYMGNSGTSTGHHLHFEIRAPGRSNKVNPGPFFRKNPPGGITFNYSPEVSRVAQQYGFTSGGEGFSSDGDDVYVDAHGAQLFTPIAVTNYNPDDPLIRELTDDLNKLSLRVANTASCIAAQNIDPHVYVNMGLLPPVMRDAMVENLSDAVGHQATLTTLNALVFKFSMALAQTGEATMNPATRDFAMKQLELLRTMREALQSDFDMTKEVSDRVQEMNDYVDEMMRRNQRRR